MALDPVPHLLSFCSTHVVHGQRPVALVARPDGDWCFTCGGVDHVGIDDHCMCAMSHLVDDDPSLREVLDLEPWQEAERVELGGSWFRSPIPADFDS